MIEKLKKVKLKGNESFNIREGWLRKGMRCVDADPRLFLRDDVMEELGVGSKMVKSIRFWLQACDLVKEEYPEGGRARIQSFTLFGETIKKYDPYFDDIFTLWLVHANIVANTDLCMAWNIFFNEFEGEDFSKENMFDMCRAQLIKKMDEGASFSDSSLLDDCSSILKMYVKAEIVDDPEESLGCPLSELGLIQHSSKSKNQYSKATPASASLDKLAVLYLIFKNLSEGKNSVSISELLFAPNNIGKVFNLNRVLINEYLDQLRVAKYITLNRTAGLDMVYVDSSMPLDEIMRKYYENVMVR